jgi:hypothetical protein
MGSPKNTTPYVANELSPPPPPRPESTVLCHRETECWVVKINDISSVSDMSCDTRASRNDVEAIGGGLELLQLATCGRNKRPH